MYACKWLFLIYSFASATADSLWFPTVEGFSVRNEHTGLSVYRPYRRRLDIRSTSEYQGRKEGRKKREGSFGSDYPMLYSTFNYICVSFPLKLH